MIKTRVASGRHAPASEVARDAPRLLERADRRGKVEKPHRLREAWEEGAVSGDAGRAARFRGAEGRSAGSPAGAGKG